MRIVILGLSLTSSWGNNHAGTYRALMRGLHQRGHSLLFLERELSWYADRRDLPGPAFGHTALYRDVAELHNRFAAVVRAAELVIVGSRVPDGIEVCEWVLHQTQGITAFYDLDTAVTLAMLATDTAEYISRELVPRFDLYLSSTGGPTLRRIEGELGARRARPLYPSVDTQLYYPDPRRREWHLGYTGAFSESTQKSVQHLMLDVARIWPRGRFVIVGAQYPERISWPRNVAQVGHLPPAEQRGFYNAQGFLLSVTPADQVTTGYSPGASLLEAAACGTPAISDEWAGLDTFFEPRKEILVARDTVEVRDYLRSVSARERARLSAAARGRCLAEHTAETRAAQLESYVREARSPVVRVSVTAP
jgi:spore maturation protein CgeB